MRKVREKNERELKRKMKFIILAVTVVLLDYVMGVNLTFS